MRNASNSLGWEIQEFILPKGWTRIKSCAKLFLTVKDAVKEMKLLESPEIELRVYEALE